MTPLDDLIAQAEAEHPELASNPGLLASLIGRGENSGSMAVSPRGARGRAQLMPGTAADLGVSDPTDDTQAIPAAARYLADNVKRFGVRGGVAAYNAGPGAVQRHGGIPPYPETQAYVDRVTGGLDGSDIFSDDAKPALAAAPGPTAQADPADGSDIFQDDPADGGVSVGARGGPVDISIDKTPEGLAAEDAAALAARQRQQQPYEEAKANIARNNTDLGDVGRTFRQAGQGALFGFGDELNGAVAGAMAAAQGKDFGDTYAGTVRAMREDESAYSDRHPKLSMGAELAGGLAGGGGLGAVGELANLSGRVAQLSPAASRLLQDTSLGARVGKSALAGTAYGGLQGAGTSRSMDELPGSVLKGAGAGLALGAVLPPAIAGLIKAPGAMLRSAQGAMAAGDETAARMLGMMGRESPAPSPAEIARAGPTADDFVADLIARSKTPMDRLAANADELAGEPVTLAEAVGAPAMSQLKNIGQRVGTTGESLESAIRQRTQSVPQRLQDDVAQATGIDPAAVAGDFAEQAKNLRAKAAPLYDAAYAGPAIKSDSLDALLKRPSMQDALGRALNIAREEGRNPQDLATYVGRRFEANRAGSGDKGMVTRERLDWGFTPQTWDYVKRGLDDVLETYRDGTTGKLRLDERGRAVLGTLNELRGELVQRNPAYGAALDAGGEPLRLEEAYHNAARMVDNGVSERVFADRFGKWSPSQQQAATGGYLNKLYEQVQNGRLRLKDMAQPVFGAKLRMMVGDEAADRVLDSVERKMRLNASGQRINPRAGSETSGLEGAERDRVEALQAAVGVTKKLANGKPLSAAVQAIASPLVAAYRGSQAPQSQAVRDAIGVLLADRPSAGAALMQRRAAAAAAGRTTAAQKAAQRTRRATAVSPYLSRALLQLGINPN